MYWADKIAKEIVDSGKHRPYWVDDMKTPSGRVHIGSVRAVTTHDLIYRSLKDLKQKVEFTYVLEDHDPMDGLPVYLDQKEYSKHLGKPLYAIPSPEPGFKSFGDRWGQEYIEIFNKLGIHPRVIWGSDLYRSGKMNDMVRLCLDKTQIIREIYGELYNKPRPKDWHPFSVVCEKCGKLSTTSVTDWDGEMVTYECKVDGLDWTDGCGNKGKVSPFSDEKRIAGKIPWKVEWPCKWKIIGVTVEGAGKDHMTAGGSHDFAKLVCERVLNYPVPYSFLHEFILIGGKKMSSSKGLGSSAKEISEIIPPYLIRFMIARVKYNEQINFDPNGITIADLFDQYDEAAKSFWTNAESDKGRVFTLSQIDENIPKEHYLPRFRDVANFLQLPNIDLTKKFEEEKGSKLDKIEQDELKERVKYAKIWLEKYAPSEFRSQMAESVPLETRNLTDEQKTFLKGVIKLVEDASTPDKLQLDIYNLSKTQGINAKDAFSAIYLVFIGKTNGPKAGWFLLQYPKEKVITRLKEVAGR